MGLKVAVYVAAPYSHDEIFDPHSPLNRDNCLAGMRELKRALEVAGAQCHTYDEYSTRPDVVLFLDVPERPVNELLGVDSAAIYKCVVLQEPEVIIPGNWDIARHAQFDRIFTWNDALVDNVRYFKFNYGNLLPACIPKELTSKEKLCVMIAGNRRSSHALELYSKRQEAIRWFEANHPNDFALYGRGWDKHLFHGPKIWRALNRVAFLGKIFSPRFSSYRGGVDKKTDVLGRHRFCICYENSTGMPGYISEKIFDSFVSGCVPVYWGAPNVKDHIPAGCFLDRRDFPDYQALYERMRAMPDAEYLAILDEIEVFLNGEKGWKFSAEYFGATMASQLLHQ